MLLAAPMKTYAQETDKETKKESVWSMFKFKGVGISADIFGCAAALINDNISTEVAVEANFGNRIYPVFEVGYDWCNTTDMTSGISYRANAPYYRAGINYNFFTKKDNPNPKHYIYGLVRLGWSNFRYDVTTPPITDPVWGGEVALDLKDVKGASLWGEIGAGIKVKIAKGFHMGWSIRYKYRFTEKTTPNSKMWYIPGFGINKSTCFGGSYSLTYEIPFK